MGNKTTIKNWKTSAHEGLGCIIDRLDEIWLEIGGSCHLKCGYCFAESGGVDSSSDNVSIERILDVIDEFSSFGGTRIGIVGAGEPFHKRNITDLFNILGYNKSKDIFTTIFTTGDLLTDKVLDQLDDYQNIRLLVKYNSQINAVQDKIVDSKGYTARRDDALKRMINRGYNDGSRLGVVTTLLEESSKEFPNIFRYARDNNLIFDADTPISRGRGKTCNLDAIEKIAKPVIEKLSQIDREEYGNEWESHGTYIASPPCTRFNHHLYLDKKGGVHPCVASDQVVLGNVKQESLAEIWEKDITKIIRGHNYVGKCIDSCKNYEEKKCFSCLGRATEELNTESLLKNGYVRTVGCFNFKHKDKK
ncbi:radical SAM protein [Candidatus Woesearchaeota archaeon]|jgi:MoaA/NifB/PqqE/SkfB family radical SAM enzyme|nr:radical SAM protein [Candidatus Woesearchaeota archaeon]MBT4336404.1 radical SAM protein [Candidatus Woesearchaeota archaeon]MBT4469941.1 radical SAM protein [Candidatus Woesearchaeota archaeon]MBT6744335.1 radical SAM protein [Candidatus Woesearchaeota archaeon]